jgi:hypothetical protein
MSHKVLEALLKKARAAHKKVEPPAGDATLQLMLAVLGSNIPLHTAELGLDRLLKAFVDVNELRMSLGDELQEALGVNYPQGRERLVRLTEALNDVFGREHQMDMSSLKGKGKREQREYLDTIRGLTHAMAAQVFCLAFEGHCVPVDERTLAALKDAGALEDNCDLQHAENIVTRCVKAGEAVETFLALHAWVDANPPKVWPPKPVVVPVFVAPPAPAKKAAAAIEVAPIAPVVKAAAPAPAAKVPMKAAPAKVVAKAPVKPAAKTPAKPAPKAPAKAPAKPAAKSHKKK